MSKYKFNKNAVCPWCDYEHEEPYEFFNSSDGDGSVSEVLEKHCEVLGYL